MAFSHIQPSFAAGELSPSLFARVDLAKYASGVALARNFFVDYRGGMSNRAGTQYIASVDGSGGQPRAIPFTVATTSSFICVFGQEYIQFFTNGAYIAGADLATPYQASDLPLLKYVQSSTVLTLTHPSYPPYNLTQTGPSTFSLTEAVTGPTVQPPSALVGVRDSGTYADGVYSYVVTAVNAQGNEESLACSRVDVVANLPGHTDEPLVNIQLTWAAPSTPASYYNIYKTGPTSAGSGSRNATPVNTVFGYLGQTICTTFTDEGVQTSAPDFTRTPPQYQDPFSPGQIAQVTVTNGGTAGYTAPPPYTTPLIFTGGGGTGAAGYAVLDTHAGKVVGVVMTSFGKGYTTAPAVTDGIGNATYAATLGQLSGTYPGVPTYFQQRRTFGGTPNFPESFVTSQPGEYNNFDTSAVSAASDSITVSLASRQDNSIKGMIPMSTGLVIFTTGGAFLVSGGNQQAAITPSDVVAFPQASSGANDLPPLQVNYDILYCQNRGATVRDLAFNFYVQNYTGTDRSVLSSHLFTGFTLNEWCYAEEPYRQILVVRDDGVLLAFTYVPEQEVFAWTHYDTNGLYVSVATVPEGATNAVYVIVKRLQGGTQHYFLERFNSRIFNYVQDTWFVDAGLALPQTYPSANLTVSVAVPTVPPSPNAVGTVVNLVADAAVFSEDSVGDIIWAGQGQIQVTAYTDSEHCTGEVMIPLQTYLNDPFFNIYPFPFEEGDWTLDTPVTTVSGLDYLDGLYVAAIADGVPVAPQIVTAGSITLPQPATKVVAGLPYQSQMMTLKLDLGEPTTQGKRKNIAAGVWRLNNTLGLKVSHGTMLNGQAVSNSLLVEMKDSFTPYSIPNPLYSGDLRTVIGGQWDEDGQLFFQQDNPLPCTILGVIPEVVVGDTQR